MESFRLLLVLVLAPQLVAAEAPIRAVLAVPTEAKDLLAGATLGAEEARRTAKLLRRDFALTTAHDDPPDDVVAITSEDAAIVIRTPDGLRYRIPFRDGAMVAWHPDLFRYGAGELNERYKRATGMAMSAEAWAAWLAIKMIVEAALRDRHIGAMRIDGHKGVPLRFDENRVLIQPMYQVNDD